MTPLQVAVLAEGEDDDAVAREIVAHIRGVAVEPVPVMSLRDRGKAAVLRQMPQVVSTVYYHTNADALVVLADNDLDVPHDPRTHTSSEPFPGCRWCALHSALQTALARTRPVPGRNLITAVGCPVPAIEAWLLAGATPEGSEAAWTQRGVGAAAGALAYKRKLKQQAYGSVQHRTDRRETATRLIRRALASPGLLRTAFPGGYGPFEDAILAW